MIETSRRSFITGLVSFVAAPAIVRAANIMPVKSVDLPNGILWEFTQDGMVYGRSPMMDALPLLQDLAVYGSAAYETRDGKRYHIPIQEWHARDGWEGFPGR
jgi:hypothetical protein